MSDRAAGFEIRGATSEDVDALFDLSRHLNSVNLPYERRALEDIVAHSERSFRGDELPPAARRYMFVLHDLAAQRVAGTSMIIAKLGTRAAPYVYFDVYIEERYSPSLDRHFRHTLLRAVYSYDGPTELGGLVVHPDYRHHPARLGKLISFARLLYIAARPELFESTLLAELMPPLEPDGTSHLWEAVGRHFTGLDYRRADKLSRENKEFIKSLFPDTPICASLLPEAARAVIGEVGEATRAVERMLRGVGFHYAHRVDPFDGGPHYVASTTEVAPMRELRELPAPESEEAPLDPERHYLVGALLSAAPYVRLRSALGRERTALVEALALGPEQPLWAMPVDRPWA